MPSNRGINIQGRDGELHLLDNSQASATTAATPWGFKVAFSQMDMTINFPPRPEEMTRQDRERLTTDAHYVPGSELPLMDPVDVGWTFLVSSRETDAVLQFVGVQYMGEEGAATSAWNVKGTPTAGLVSTKSRPLSGSGNYIGGRIDGKGSAIRLPVFGDVKKVALDVETSWTERDGSNRYGLRLKEVFFDPSAQSVGEGADQVVLNLTGRVYGEYQRLTAFTRALDVLTNTLI